MGAGAAIQAWNNSRATNGPLLVLMAIAFEADEKGECVMSVAELARKARLSDRAVRSSVAELGRLGELEVVSGGSGRGNRTAYRLAVKAAESATFEPETRQNLPPLNPAESATFSDGAPKKPQVSAKAEKSATFAASDALKGSVVSGRKSRSREAPAPHREDVDRLCAHLADRIAANGSSRPVIGKKWRDAARLLIDKDGRTEENIHRAIDWSQQDHFWHRNILSMPKLREHYDRLQLDAKAEQRKKAQPSAGRGNPDDEYQAAMQRIQSRREHANGTRGDGDNRPPRQVSLPPAAN